MAAGGGAAGKEINSDDPDLVAYWKFDEGSGYVVHDAAGHGHDLHILNEPKWQVSEAVGILRSLRKSTFCRAWELLDLYRVGLKL